MRTNMRDDEWGRETVVSLFAPSPHTAVHDMHIDTHTLSLSLLMDMNTHTNMYSLS